MTCSTNRPHRCTISDGTSWIHLSDRCWRIRVLNYRPKWNYDGSSTGQAPGEDSEVILYPQSIYKDPFRGGDNIMVMCDLYKPNGEPLDGNTRKECNEVMDKVRSSREEVRGRHDFPRTLVTGYLLFVYVRDSAVTYLPPAFCSNLTHRLRVDVPRPVASLSCWPLGDMISGCCFHLHVKAWFNLACHQIISITFSS